MVNILLGWIAASFAWFIVGGILYTNPITAKIYKNAEVSPALKKWDSIPKYIGLQHVGILIQCFLWAFVFAYLKPVLPVGVLMQGVVFGLILLATKMIPRLYDMWIQSTYPNNLLAIELVFGTIGGFVVGIVFALLI